MEKILVIEDEKDVRQSILDLLEYKGYEAIEASNGKEALELIKEIIPDLVISDIMMPELSGYTILHEFQNNPVTASIPFIFLSAKADLTDIRKGMNRGADDFITKPFKANELLSSIEIRLKKKKSLDEKLNELRRSITMYVPHELRTPLVAILGYSDMILGEFKQLSSNEIFDMITRIKKAGERLHLTIEKFVIYSELECTDIQDRPVTQNGLCVESVKNCFDDIMKKKFGRSIRKNDFQIGIEDCAVLIQKRYFEILIGELLDNAVKFSSKGSSISISCFATNGMYKIVIIDNGTGMTQDEINAVDGYRQFNREFFQQNGNGLGLIIAKKIVMLYKGNLSIDSVKNKYTKVTVLLPIFK